MEDNNENEAVRKLEDVAKERRERALGINRYNKNDQFDASKSPFNELGEEKIDPDEEASLIAEERRNRALKQNLFTRNEPYQKPDTSNDNN